MRSVSSSFCENAFCLCNNQSATSSLRHHSTQTLRFLTLGVHQTNSKSLRQATGAKVNAYFFESRECTDTDSAHSIYIHIKQNAWIMDTGRPGANSRVDSAKYICIVQQTDTVELTSHRNTEFDKLFCFDINDSNFIYILVDFAHARASCWVCEW